jgi:tRNA threonylcarbamoyladenosine biosynthesis protein TsaB
MNVLALDTSTEACSVALFTERGMIGLSNEVGRGHAEQILGMVDAILAKGGLSLKSLDALAAGVGPGSFTGVRIGVSVAQGLCFGAQLSVVPVTTLEALALQAIESGAREVLACLDARMGEVYWQCFTADAGRGLRALGAPAVAAAEAVAVPFAPGFHGIGRGFSAYPALQERLSGMLLTAEHRRALPDARHIARLGVLRCSLREQLLDPADLQPVYVRDKVAFTEIERAAAR